jgi:hypothetical protein
MADRLTPRWHAWLLLGAWALWSFYAGHNICLPNLALKLAPVSEKSPYVAAHEAVASLFHGLITLAGGFLFDWLNDSEALSRIGLSAINHYLAIFGLAVLFRMLAVLLAMAIDEQGAWKWREIVRQRRNAATAIADGRATV